MASKQKEISQHHAKTILIRSTKKLCGYFNPDGVLLTLQAEEAVKLDDVTRINAKVTNTEKVQTLLLILAESSVSSYLSFMGALLEDRPDLHAKVLAIQEEVCDPSSIQVSTTGTTETESATTIEGGEDVLDGNPVNPKRTLSTYSMGVEPDSGGKYTSIPVKAAKPSPGHLDSNENYNMKKQKKGLAYILNNSYFPDRREKKYRSGSEEDFVNMKHLFTELGYEIEPRENLKAQEILQTMKDFVSKFNDTDSHLSAVVVLMSHGNAGYILGTDENKVEVKKIQELFEGKLTGKPKLFFIQACRGNLTASPIEPDNVRDDANPKVDADNDFPKDIPNNADMHFAYATPEGYLSLRDNTNGSWFIQAITEVFLAHAHEENLDNLMNKVTKRVTELKGNFFDHQQGKWVYNAKQTPQIVKQGMRKALYFLPKYPQTC